MVACWGPMIDLHCHILPGLDDGAADLSISASHGAGLCRRRRDHGCLHAAHPAGRLSQQRPWHPPGPPGLQQVLDQQDIPLRLIEGADVHVAPDLVTGLRDGHIPSLNGSRYVLIEPPHHVMPPRLEDIFFGLLVAGYVPILTHPERLTWIKSHYATIEHLARSGVWMQITAGSLTGAFGRQALYWSERMLDEGLVHILATDAHDTVRRPPVLSQGRDIAAKRVGAAEAEHLVATRPRGIVENEHPSNLPPPRGRGASWGK